MDTLGHPYATTADSVKLSITTSEPFDLLSQTASWICFHSCCHSGRKSCMKTWQTAGLGFQNAAKDLSAILKDTKFDSTAFFPESCNLTVALYSNLPQSLDTELSNGVKVPSPAHIGLVSAFLSAFDKLSQLWWSGGGRLSANNIKVFFLIGSLNMTLGP